MVETLPNGELFYSPLGIFPFQEDGIARTYLDIDQGGGKIVCWDTGTGKSVMGLRLATLYKEDDLNHNRRHDLTIVICEKNKVSEWYEDFKKFTTLNAVIYHGQGRTKKIEAGFPDVLITTYETGKCDFVNFVKPPGKRGFRVESTELLERIQGKSVLWIFDEVAKLRNRSSSNYKAYAYIMKIMAKHNPKDHRAVGLTATPIEKDWEDAFNQGRLIAPDYMPTVTEFERYFVRSRDEYGRPHFRDDRMQEFSELFRPILLRKRKTDSDVIDQFPKRVEEARHIEMLPAHRDLYQLVESMQDDQEEPVAGLWGVLRQVAGHPRSLIRSAAMGDSEISKMLVSELGSDYLRDIPSTKTIELIDYLKPLVLDQDQKVVVFTFFGQSVLPLLASALRNAGMKVYENHGGLNSTQMGEVRQNFKTDPIPCVFLTSDAGSRGINLPEATYVVEYESALTYANRVQRLDRIHRIDSKAPSVTCQTLILNGTVEAGIMDLVSKRNEMTDVLLGDEDAGENFISSAERRELLQISKLQRTKRRS